MFEILDNKVFYNNKFFFLLPEELYNIKFKKAFCTATSGLARRVGIVISSNGHSVSTLCAPSGEQVSGHALHNEDFQNKKGTLVYLREQYEPVAPHRPFWIISKNEIKSDINWINILFENKKQLKICPFTLQYEILENA